MKKQLLGCLLLLIQIGFGNSVMPVKSSLETQKELFEQNGFVWIQGFYSQEQVLLLRYWADAIDETAQRLLSLSQDSGFSLQMLAKSLSSTPIVVAEVKDPLKVCRAEDLILCEPAFYEFVCSPLTLYLESLLGEPYTLFKDKINFKWPGGGAFPPHQDFPAFEFFGPREHITAMVCIDEATLENGCLQIAQNWKESFQDDPRIDQEKLSDGNVVLPYIEGGSQHGSILPELCQKISWLPIQAKPGDVVFFNSFVPHYSETNSSSCSRRALFLTYNRLKEGRHRESYYHMKRNDPDNPMFHFGTPTHARGKGS
jgi:ectoine hydroxylase-related dioxygenase (phytanoyl-CoA dioxygenase family)